LGTGKKSYKNRPGVGFSLNTRYCERVQVRVRFRGIFAPAKVSPQPEVVLSASFSGVSARFGTLKR